MKIKQNLLVVCVVVTMMQPILSKAQTINKRANVTLTQSDWKPVNKFVDTENKVQQGTEIVAKPPLTNVINGVSFYSKKSECNSEEVRLIKVTNVNSNPVKISWQKGPEFPVEFVIIPASKEVEGSCVGQPKLIISLPKDKTEREKIA